MWLNILEKVSKWALSSDLLWSKSSIIFKEIHEVRRYNNSVLCVTGLVCVWGHKQVTIDTYDQMGLSHSQFPFEYLCLYRAHTVYLTNNPIRSVQFLLHLPSFERRVPHFLLKRAAHTTLFHTQYVAVNVTYDLTHD